MKNQHPKLTSFLKENGLPTSITPSMEVMLRNRMKNMSDDSIIESALLSMKEPFMIELVEMERSKLFESYIKGDDIPYGSYLKEPITEGEIFITSMVLHSDYIGSGKNSMLYQSKDKLKENPHTLPHLLLIMICKHIRKEGLDISHITNFLNTL